MMQINNLEGKSDWINETQLLIPMVENEEISSKEMDGISKHTITLNSLEGSDQSLLTNGTGQTFVIGLDQTLFENYSGKSDLLLMSNSDLKLLPTVSESKLTYSLTSIEQSKGIVWENNAFEKPLTKDILNVIQETSKEWQDMGKNGEICLDNINVHENKLNEDFLIEPHISQSKKLRSDSSDQYIVGYYPVVESCETVLVPASLMTIQQRTVGNEQSKGMTIAKNVLNNSKNMGQLFGNENAQSSKWMKSESSTDNFVEDKINDECSNSIIKMNDTQENSLILTQENLSESTMPLINSTNDNFMNAKSKNDINYDEGVKCIVKDDKFSEKIVENENRSLPEQSLPLKKKAKMKKSPMNGNSNLLSCDAARIIHGFTEDCQTVNENPVPNHSERNSESDSENPSSNRSKRTKSDGTGYNFKKKRKKNQAENQAERSKVTGEKGAENNRYNNITEVLEQLRSEKCINDAIFKILRSGLEEMKVDVLREMCNKRNDLSSDYSSHLKAFALMIHFKQPIAFNRLSEIFGNGWPSLAVIKDWKRRLNNRRRPKANK